MNKQNSASPLLFGLAIFVGLMPLAFTFSQNEIQPLLNTSFKYMVWGGQTIVLLLLLFSKYQLIKNQLIALIVLYACVPFIFTFNENGATFLILTKYTSSVLSWAIASVVISKLFFLHKLEENSNL
jgi:hypothetical protein